MATKFLGLIIVAGFLWSPVRNQCLKSRCKLRSVYRYMRSQTKLQSLMKVEVQNGIPTETITFLGKSKQRSVTEFVIERCPRTSGPGLVVTIQWNQSYYLVVEAGNIKLKRVSTVTNDHRFYLVAGSSSNNNYVTFQSKTASKFIKTNSHGHASLGNTSRNRRAWFWMESCILLT